MGLLDQADEAFHTYWNHEGAAEGCPVCELQAEKQRTSSRKYRRSQRQLQIATGLREYGQRRRHDPLAG